MKTLLNLSALASVLILVLSSPTSLAATTPLSLKPLSFSADARWQQFRLPNVQLHNTAGPMAVWDQLDVALVRQISYNVARLLYNDVKHAPNIPTINLVLENFDGVAWKEGDFNGVTIHVSADYLKKYAKMPDSERLSEELIGILYHEIAHGYQRDDNNYKNIGGVIEGIADVVRHQAGYVDNKHRKAGGNFDDGYKNTAFFLVWLEQHKYPGLLQQLNLALDASDDITWSWKGFEHSLNVPLSELWEEYQRSI